MLRVEGLEDTTMMNALSEDGRTLRNLALTIFAFMVITTGLVGLAVVLGQLH